MRKHRWSNKKNLLVPHRTPEKPRGHRHINVPSVLIQVAVPEHGLFAQKSMAESRGRNIICYDV